MDALKQEFGVTGDSNWPERELDGRHVTLLCAQVHSVFLVL